MKYIKNAISILLVLLILMSFVSCKSDTEKGKNEGGKDTEQVSGNVNDKVKIEVPLEMIPAEYREDLPSYAEKNGYYSAVYNKKKDTVTITMRELTHNLLKTRIGLQVIGDIYDFASDKKYSYLVSIDNIDQDNFTSAEITVKEKAYKKDGTILPFMIAEDLLMYQMYAGVKVPESEVTVKNQKGEIIDKVTSSAKDK